MQVQEHNEKGNQLLLKTHHTHVMKKENMFWYKAAVEWNVISDLIQYVAIFI